MLNQGMSLPLAKVAIWFSPDPATAHGSSLNAGSASVDLLEVLLSFKSQ